MNINMQGHHVELTSALEDYVKSKFKKLDRFDDHLNNIHVILRVEKVDQTAEATLNIHQTELYASATSDNMYASIDALTDKLIRQLNKHKNKLKNH